MSQNGNASSSQKQIVTNADAKRPRSCQKYFVTFATSGCMVGALAKRASARNRDRRSVPGRLMSRSILVRLSRFCSGVAAMLLAPSAAANAAPVPSQLAKMDAEGFRSTTTVDDDDLEFSTIISTRDSFRKERRVNGSTWADGHVEAHIDKRTGDIRFEVHQSLRYRGSQRQYDVVHFEDRDGRLVARPLDRALRGDDTMCPNSDFTGDCALTMKLVFSVDEDLLKAITDRGESWDLKFKGRPDGQDDLRIKIVAAEIEGLLLAVEGYRANSSMSASS
ncbi:hypothetical protein [Sphingopyxis sp. C-1]|uniref:hypothetical protein n=1 Tax=Sphingopyxis sp. C-1 TaxID=262667 RepID=UPI00187BFBC1|nr:hypothetical protein [Sphingopyxis sp. C-1]